jgi:hypothetical protein
MHRLRRRRSTARRRSRTRPEIHRRLGHTPGACAGCGCWRRKGVDEGTSGRFAGIAAPHRVCQDTCHSAEIGNLRPNIGNWLAARWRTSAQVFLPSSVEVHWRRPFSIMLTGCREASPNARYLAGPVKSLLDRQERIRSGQFLFDLRHQLFALHPKGNVATWETPWERLVDLMIGLFARQTY